MPIVRLFGMCASYAAHIAEKGSAKRSGKPSVEGSVGAPRAIASNEVLESGAFRRLKELSRRETFAIGPLMSFEARLRTPPELTRFLDAAQRPLWAICFGYARGARSLSFALKQRL